MIIGIMILNDRYCHEYYYYCDHHPEGRPHRRPRLQVGPRGGEFQALSREEGSGVSWRLEISGQPQMTSLWLIQDFLCIYMYNVYLHTCTYIPTYRYSSVAIYIYIRTHVYVFIYIYIYMFFHVACGFRCLPIVLCMGSVWLLWLVSHIGGEHVYCTVSFRVCICARLINGSYCSVSVYTSTRVDCVYT